MVAGTLTCCLHVAANLGADCPLGGKEGPCGPGRADPGGCNECLLKATLKCFQLRGGRHAPPSPRPHGTQLVPVVNVSPIHYFTHVKFKRHFYMIMDIFKALHSGREQSRESRPNPPASRAIGSWAVWPDLYPSPNWISLNQIPDDTACYL